MNKLLRYLPTEPWEEVNHMVVRVPEVIRVYSSGRLEWLAEATSGENH